MEISLIDKLSGFEFEGFVKKLLEDLGFRNIKNTKKSGDFGVDLIAERNSKKYVIQTKRHNKEVGLKAVQEAFAGKQFYKANFCMVVSNNEFTKAAIELAATCDCKLIGRKDIVKWLNKKFASSEEFLDFIEQKEIKKFKISTNQLVEEYKILKNKLGRIPIISEVDKCCKYSSSVYRKRWGSWNNFLRSLNEPIAFVKNIAKEDLINNFLTIKQRLGKIPTRQEMRPLGKFSASVYERRFGSWNRFLTSMGEKLNKKQEITKDEFISDFVKVKQKIGHAPTANEMKKYGTIAPTSYRRIWGSWTNFLKEHGEKHQERNISEENLIKEYLRTKKLLRKDSLTQSEMDNFGKFSSSVYVRRFGNWNKFLRHIGDKVNRDTEISERDLINDYHRRNFFAKLTSSGLHNYF